MFPQVTKSTAEQQYLQLASYIVHKGTDIFNERTGKNTRTIIDANLVYHVDDNELPLLTSRKSYWKAAVAEFLGYLKGYRSAAQFRELGAKTWDANANENKAWLANQYRTGEDDMGRVYGVQLRDWRNLYNQSFDQLRKVYENLKKGIDDRGEIMTFWNAGEHDMGCLRACMHTHTFSLVNGVLHLTSYQRSCDVPLGLNFNMVQCFFFLKLMAQITGHKAGKVYHKIVNAHIYEDQLEPMKEQLKRSTFRPPTMNISPSVCTLDDVIDWMTPEHCEVLGYEYNEPIKFPFAV